MRHAQTDHAPRADDILPDEFDSGFDVFASTATDDYLDRQLFAIRESLADFRSL
jgi:hypothetical protein